MPIPHRNLHLNVHLNQAILAATKSVKPPSIKARVLLLLHGQKGEFIQSLFQNLLQINF